MYNELDYFSNWVAKRRCRTRDRLNRFMNGFSGSLMVVGMVWWRVVGCGKEVKTDEHKSERTSSFVIVESQAVQFTMMEASVGCLILLALLEWMADGADGLSINAFVKDEWSVRLVASTNGWTTIGSEIDRFLLIGRTGEPIDSLLTSLLTSKRIQMAISQSILINAFHHTPIVRPTMKHFFYHPCRADQQQWMCWQSDQGSI